MNAHICQSEQARAELENLVAVEKNVTTGQSSKPIINICQDVLTGGYLMTYKKVPIHKSVFFDACCIPEEWDFEFLTRKMDHIERMFNNTGFSVTSDEKESPLFTGHGLFSMTLPFDFSLKTKNTFGDFIIERGVLVKGTLDKKMLGNQVGSIVHYLALEYDGKTACDFVSNYQFLVNYWLLHRGFSIGISDCIPSKEITEQIQKDVNKSFLEVQTSLRTEKTEEAFEKRTNMILNSVVSLGQKITTENLNKENALRSMILSGAKGNFVNVSQIMGLLGQQNVNGARIPCLISGYKRTLYTYPKQSHPTVFGHQNMKPRIKKTQLPFKRKFNEIGQETVEADKIRRHPFYNFRLSDKTENIVNSLDKHFESKGFIKSSFIQGLTPQEFFFHSMSGRIGILDTAVKTAKCGYLSRKMIKTLEDMKISYTGQVVNSKNNIIAFGYNDGIDSSKTMHGKFVDVQRLIDRIEMNED